ncbi:MAG TPA: cob(I)yrinic acid a,c-diamide adenosyltransferase [Desulfobacteria bacterium]|nr:cob(I)yrinic acid a,c-diamide adenosyltransferase [Desulfobacteria bacterium]
MEIIRELGLVQVYTGEGKGKTTASLGLAFRAVGHGFRVHMIQFMKGRGYAGELVSARRLSPELTISQYGRNCTISAEIQQGYKKCTGCGDCFVKDRGINPEDIRLAESALEEARDFLKNKKCDILILDEIGNTFRYDLVKTDTILELIKTKPRDVELILTGRGMPSEICDAADLVTEMREIKHPFNSGISSRRGIEY